MNFFTSSEQVRLLYHSAGGFDWFTFQPIYFCVGIHPPVKNVSNGCYKFTIYFPRSHFWIQLSTYPKEYTCLIPLFCLINPAKNRTGKNKPENPRRNLWVPTGSNLDWLVERYNIFWFWYIQKEVFIKYYINNIYLSRGYLKHSGSYYHKYISKWFIYPPEILNILHKSGPYRLSTNSGNKIIFDNYITKYLDALEKVNTNLIQNT